MQARHAQSGASESGRTTYAPATDEVAVIDESGVIVSVNRVTTDEPGTAGVFYTGFTVGENVLESYVFGAEQGDEFAFEALAGITGVLRHTRSDCVIDSPSRHCSLSIISLSGHMGAVLIYQHQFPTVTSGEHERAILSGIPDMVFTIDRSAHYLTFTPAQGMTPFVPPSVFLGKTIEEIMPPEIASPCRVALELAFTTNCVQTVEYELVEDDIPRWYECRIGVISPDEAMAIVRDVTVQKQQSRGAPKQAMRTDEAQPPGTANSYSLSARELMVLELISQGLSDKEVAAELKLKTFTIHKYVSRILVKMGAASRTEVAVRALREGILPSGQTQ